MTDTKNTGGPAFPIEDEWVRSYGMTLRDWFAGQALSGIASLGGDGFSISPDDAAGWAYQQADAMLAVRIK